MDRIGAPTGVIMLDRPSAGWPDDWERDDDQRGWSDEPEDYWTGARTYTAATCGTCGGSGQVGCTTDAGGTIHRTTTTCGSCGGSGQC